MAKEASAGRVVKVSGPLVIARGLQAAKMFEMVRVGKLHLFGEIIEIRKDLFSIQVYEETEGIAPGDVVEATGMPLSVELGPGLIGTIYDGVQRPLNDIKAKTGDFIVKGVDSPSLDRTKRWEVKPVRKEGESVVGGDIIATIPETPLMEHRIMVPPGVKGKLVKVASGELGVEESVATVETEKGSVEIPMFQRWPVRQPRPVRNRKVPTVPLVTGQRIIDMLFPMAKGGRACVPGPFGSGKTVVQHQLAKWADADLIVFVGCGERGNEMADVLMEFPKLTDPKSGRPLMERTILVANTSNMPVAAREASVFTGITMAEYYRDMGYEVALMADSTSRWAEAIREMSGRLEEMPGEEGYPAYLGSRLASFYERSGMVQCLGSDDRLGSLSIIGSVSPPGGDFSEPVVQATLRVTKVMWQLDDRLASQRHFPAINWLASYSLYSDTVDKHCGKNIDEKWAETRQEALTILKRESELEELVRLVGVDSLSESERLTLQVARMIREDFLHQNAFEAVDTYTSLAKQFRMLDLIITYSRAASKALGSGQPLSKITGIPVLEEIARAKIIPEDQMQKFDEIRSSIEEAL